MIDTQHEHTHAAGSTKKGCGCGGGGGCGCGCGCAGAPPEPVTCCDLVCASRPNYFCGQLLTDQDLALGQNYFLEKNKLRNRTLHGHGVVCGLKITCDEQCKGYVRIATGYAIDDCGNDLIVCQPSRFGVIDALVKKKWIVAPPPKDPCKPDEKDPECPIRQCFYIAACYVEESAEYTSPFTAGCHTGPSDCVPARIHEKVRFDVLDRLPTDCDYFEALRLKIEACYDEFIQGQLGQKLTKYAQTLLDTVTAGQVPGKTPGKPPKKACEIFCELKAHFLHYLKADPDHFNCGMEAKVRQLECDAENPAKAICELIDLMLLYLNDCVLGALVFCCPAPCEASCVVLGTVEVLDGHIERVCNTPRRYVWSFASFWQVFLYYLHTGAALASGSGKGKDDDGKHDEDEKEKGCCPTYDIDCIQFLKQLVVKTDSRKHAATASLNAMGSLRDAMYRSFDFTSSSTISQEMLSGLSAKEFPMGADLLELKRRVVNLDEEIGQPTIAQALLHGALLRPGDHVAAYVMRKGEGLFATADPMFPSIAREEGHPTLAQVGATEDRMRMLEETIAKLQADIIDLQGGGSNDTEGGKKKGGVK